MTRKPTADAVFFIAAGILILITAYLPLEALFGAVKGMSGSLAVMPRLLGTLIVLVLAWLVNAAVSESRIEVVAARFRSGLAEGNRRLLVLLFSAAGCLLVLVSHFAFKHRPMLIDAVAQHFQGQIFADGLVKAPPPPLPAFFITPQMIIDETGWYSQYPPGHSALLALGVPFDAVWAVPIALSLLGLLFLYLFAARVYDRTTARLTLCLAVCCPFLIFMGASFMNHVSTLSLVALFLWAFACWEDEGSAGMLFIAGCALGFAALSRPLTAVAVAVPFAAIGIHSAVRHGRVRQLVAGAIGCLGAASLFLLYNRLTTGDALLSGYVKLWGSGHGLGFHRSPWGDAHTPLAGLRNELVDLYLLHEYLFEWPLPSLLPVGLFLLHPRGLTRWDRRLVILLLSVPAAYFFYWHRDSMLGPRFLYATLCALLPLSARAFLSWTKSLGEYRVGIPGLFRPVRLSHLLLTAVLLSFAYTAVIGAPQRFAIYATSLSSMKYDLGAELRRQNIPRALVFVTERWQDRALAELLEAGVPASLLERAYGGVDACLLRGIAARAKGEGGSLAEARRAIEELLAADLPLTTLRLEDGSTFKIRTGTTPDAACRDELSYDRKGAGLYLPHVLLNRPRLDGPYVVARDLRERNVELIRRFPDLPAYLLRGTRLLPLSAR